MEKLHSFSPSELQTMMCGDQSPTWTREDILNYTDPKLGYTRERWEINPSHQLANKLSKLVSNSFLGLNFLRSYFKKTWDVCRKIKIWNNYKSIKMKTNNLYLSFSPCKASYKSYYVVSQQTVFTYPFHHAKLQVLLTISMHYHYFDFNFWEVGFCSYLLILMDTLTDINWPDVYPAFKIVFIASVAVK